LNKDIFLLAEKPSALQLHDDQITIVTQRSEPISYLNINLLVDLFDPINYYLIFSSKIIYAN